MLKIDGLLVTSISLPKIMFFFLNFYELHNRKNWQKKHKENVCLFATTSMLHDNTGKQRVVYLSLNFRPNVYNSDYVIIKVNQVGSTTNEWVN